MAARCYYSVTQTIWCLVMTATTTIKLPEKLKTRIARLARETGRSAHSLMAEALEREVTRKERMREVARAALVVYSENALANLGRAFDFLAGHAPPAAVGAASAISEAVDTLSNHPLIGRTVASELRELVISYGKTGYIALYRFLPVQDQVRILAIRHQRELDYPI